MKYVLILLSLFLCNCGDNSTPSGATWGDVVDGLSSSYCEAFGKCIEGDYNTDECVKHNVFHLCELKDTCFVSVDDEALDVLAACQEALSDPDENLCVSLFFGAIPAECSDVLTFEPSND